MLLPHYLPLSANFINLLYEKHIGKSLRPKMRAIKKPRHLKLPGPSR